MAKYEQKTDSREFEVANPDQQRGTGAGEPRPEATEIAIRLWSANGDRRVPTTWKTDSVLVYMIADLVVASRGCLAESTVMAANFEGIGQALVAAKRIQTAVLEFVACRPSGPVGAAILVYQPQASDPRGFTGEMVRLALGQAKPGQILLCESISQRLSNLPGIELRAIPELTSVTADGDNGLTELVWTTPERVALLQDAVGAGAEPQDEDSSPVGATMIVHLPFAQRSFPNDAVPPVMAAEDGVFEDTSEPVSLRIDPARDQEDLAPVSEVSEESFGGSLTEELDQLKNRPLVTRTRVIVGIVAVVLAAALVAVIYRPKAVSNVPVPPQQDQNRSQEIPVKAPPPAPGPKIKVVQSDPTPIKPQIKVPPAIVQPRTPVKATVDDRVNGGKENLEVPAASYEYGGFSQKDIPKLLEFARSDAGKGNYVSARKEYSTILQLQPNNQAARDGLHKLDLIQQNQ